MTTPAAAQQWLVIANDESKPLRERLEAALRAQTLTQDALLSDRDRQLVQMTVTTQLRQIDDLRSALATERAGRLHAETDLQQVAELLTRREATKE